MELRQLEYFVAVAEEASFTRAAERVRISQPGVSAQIRQLESEVGAALFDRSARAPRLTAAGAAALGPARAALAAAAAVRQAVDEVNGLLRGRLTVGMVTACTVTPLFDALAAFHHDHPGIALTLVEDTSDLLVARVRAGTADLALIGAPGALPAGLDALPLVSERLVALVPAGHPLARRPSAPLAEIVRHPLVCLPEGTGIRAVLDQGCAARGARADIALQASAPNAVMDLAARGLGVAILSESMARPGAGPERPAAGPGGTPGEAPGKAAPAALRPVLVEDIATPALLALVWRPPGGPALRELLRHCRSTFAAAAPPPAVP